MVRPLTATYDPANPYVVERHDLDDEEGSIVYEIWDIRPDSYRRLCTISELYDSSSGRHKKDAEMIAKALNLLHKET